MRTILFRLILIVTPVILSPPAEACTTFIISGKHTPDGRPVLYKNRDTDEMRNALLYFTDGRYKYVGLVDCNENFRTMVWGGYNEAGFAIMNSAAYNNNLGDTTTFGDQEGVVMKLALQNCRNIEDFENLLRVLPKPLGVDANFGVIDAYGGAAFYETGNYKYIKYDANDQQVAPEGILIRTNYSHSADITKGFGFARYKTAAAALSALTPEKYKPEYFLNNISRNLYHSLTETYLTAKIPKKKNTPEYRFFIDFIPRNSTSSAILIMGARDEMHIREAVMWTILGFPLTSVAVPVWISAGSELPEAVQANDSLKAPLCTAALTLKNDCFPITYDRGYNYINLSALINRENKGYLQMLKPIESTIFDKASKIQEGLGSGRKSEKDVIDFYRWIDTFLSEEYIKLFGISLM
jgi:hypothetical protein